MARVERFELSHQGVMGLDIGVEPIKSTENPTSPLPYRLAIPVYNVGFSPTQHILFYYKIIISYVGICLPLFTTYTTVGMLLHKIES